MARMFGKHNLLRADLGLGCDKGLKHWTRFLMLYRGLHNWNRVLGYNKIIVTIRTPTNKIITTNNKNNIGTF